MRGSRFGWRNTLGGKLQIREKPHPGDFAFEDHRRLQQLSIQLAKEPCGQFEGIDGPVAFGAWLVDAGTPGGGAAIQNGVDPTLGHGFPTMDRAEEGAADRPGGVGVAAAHDGVDDAAFEIGGMEKLPEGVAEGEAHPTLLGAVKTRVGMPACGSAAEVGADFFAIIRGLGPGADLVEERRGGMTLADSFGDGHGVERVDVAADGVGVGDGGILTGPSGDLGEFMSRAKDAQRTDPHQGAVGLAGAQGTAAEAAGGGVADVKGIGVEPFDIFLTGASGVISAFLRQEPSQAQGHLRIIGGLAGEGVPDAAIGEVAEASGEAGSDGGS